MSPEQNPQLDAAKQHIYSIDFSNILNKMVKHQGWSKKNAEALATVYKNYLFLTRKYYHWQLPPSEELDEFWHNHILDTKQYRKDCQMIFGHYLDHYPYFGIDGKSDYSDLANAFMKMQELYKEEFNEDFPKIRNRFSKMISTVKIKFYRITLF